MRWLLRAWLVIRWWLVPYHRIYSETASEVTVTAAALDMMAQKLTRGHYCWGEAWEHVCPECGRHFWSVSDSPTCIRKECYVAHGMRKTNAVGMEN